MNRAYTRRRIVAALDVLVNGREWVGNVMEVGMECCRQGFSYASDYMIRRVLRDYGEVLGRGQYRVTHESLVGTSRK